MSRSFQPTTSAALLASSAGTLTLTPNGSTATNGRFDAWATSIWYVVQYSFSVYNELNTITTSADFICVRYSSFRASLPPALGG